MKAWLPTLLVPLAFHAHADALPLASDVPKDPFALPAPPLASAPAASARPSDEAIRAAVRATLAETPESPMPSKGTALSGGPYREFARTFSQAAKPHCLGPDPLKHQPHSTVVKTIFGDFAVGVGGIYALPFWGAAVLRGKCNWTR